MGVLEEGFKLLNQGWVGSLIALMGLLLALVFYRKSRMRPIVAYQRRGLRLIGASARTLPQEVQILFRAQPVPRLTASHLVIWNAGSATVRGSDIVGGDPLRLVFHPDTNVLRVRVVGTSRSVIAFQADVNSTLPNEVVLAFDFLDAGDGASIEILHTGHELYPQLKGTIRGIPSGIRDWGSIPSYGPKLPTEARNVLLLAGVTVNVLLVAVVAGWITLDPLPPPARQLISGVVGWVTGLGLVTFIPHLYVSLRRRFPPLLSAGELE